MKRWLFVLMGIVAVAPGIQDSHAGESKPRGYYKKLDGNTYLLALEPGAKLVESLRIFQRATGVKAASVTGVGVLKDAQLGQYRFIGESLAGGGVAAPPKFPTHDDVVVRGHREIVSLTCNLTTSLVTEKGVTKTDPHCHVALAGSDHPDKDSRNGYPVVGGHLVEGEIGVIGELFITAYPTRVNKKDGGALGGSILNLDEAEGGIPLTQ